MKSQLTLNVAIEKDEDGIYVASILELPGCISDGDTVEEALAHVREAVLGYLEVLREEGRKPPTSESVILRRLDIAIPA